MVERTLVGFNATIVAQSFNPSIVREAWLMKRGLLAEGSIAPGFVFSDQVVRVPTERFSLIVVPPQLQLAPTTREIAAEVMRDVLAPLVLALPHTPMSAAGINMIWHIDPGTESVESLTKRLFAPKGLDLADEFGTADARFGCYMSKDLGLCRLKLDIKPVALKTVDDTRRLLQCAFNFHRELSPDEAPKEICELLDHWAEYDGLSEHLTDKVVGAAG